MAQGRDAITCMNPARIFLGVIAPDSVADQPGGIVARIPMPMVNTRKPPKNHAILLIKFPRQTFVIKQAQSISRPHASVAAYPGPRLSRKVDGNFAPQTAYITGADNAKIYGSDAWQYKVLRHNTALILSNHCLAQADHRLVQFQPRSRTPTGVHRKPWRSFDRHGDHRPALQFAANQYRRLGANAEAVGHQLDNRRHRVDTADSRCGNAVLVQEVEHVLMRPRQP